MGSSPERGNRGGLCKALVKMRSFLFCSLVFFTYDLATLDPLSAALYTMVSCPRPVPTADGQCPLGSAFGNGTCEAEPPSSKHWSMSDSCLDKKYVVSRTTKFKGKVGMFRSIAELAALTFIGPVIDNVGRKPVIMLALLSQVLFCATIWLASSVEFGVTEIIAIAFMFLGASGSLFGPASKAMVADLSRSNEKLRADGFAALGVMGGLSYILGIGMMFPILHAHLSDYRAMWGVFAAVGIVALTISHRLLRETMPPLQDVGSEEATPATAPASCWQTGLAQMTRGIKLVSGDPFLRQYLVLSGFAFVSVGKCFELSSSYAIIALNYDNSKASLAGIFIPICSVFASAASSPLIRNFGLQSSVVVALLLASFGFLLMGLGGPLSSMTEVLYWMGLIVAGSAFPVVVACDTTIISMRVTRGNQGSVFAANSFVGSVLGMTFGLLWPEFLFEPEAKGWRLGAPFFAATSVLVLSTLWLVALWRAVGSHEESTEATSDEDYGDVKQGVSESASSDEFE